ncbi:pilus assembly protein [Streptomyces sp. RY43-2]|uniref:Pilus assembly protein n=1 Tax=Streptomyces macrolidinus TaxID=2952607 RepID=A0ABT0ZLL9_9ACTN|nr:pilus assembly protein [Streptomyces macrolidinus]MCN9244466.1 pilus assembly protein [Streptomyces macrolidinus]
MGLRVGGRRCRTNGAPAADTGRGLRGERGGDQGQMTIEFTTMAPIILATIVLLWQAVLTGYGLVLAGNAADKAVRAGATVDTWRESRDQACKRAGREDLPDGWTSRIHCYADGDMVKASVRVKVPVLFPGGVNFPMWISSKSAAAKES